VCESKNVIGALFDASSHIAFLHVDIPFNLFPALACAALITCFPSGDDAVMKFHVSPRFRHTSSAHHPRFPSVSVVVFPPAATRAPSLASIAAYTRVERRARARPRVILVVIVAPRVGRPAPPPPRAGRPARHLARASTDPRDARDGANVGATARVVVVVDMSVVAEASVARRAMGRARRRPVGDGRPEGDSRRVVNRHEFMSRDSTWSPSSTMRTETREGRSFVVDA
jgi:hypothetical protein